MPVNQTAESLQVESSENLHNLAKAMGKLLIVSLVWSGTDMLNKNLPTEIQPPAEPAQ